MAGGTKRASPGADEEKKNPLQSTEVSEEDQAKLVAISKDIARAELVLERHAQRTLIPVYQKRREVLKTVADFWPVALMNNTMFGFHVSHTSDQSALSYLEDLWVARDPTEPRSFAIEFYFKENPYFSDSVLTKNFKYTPPATAADEKPDADGITESMLDFSWERDIVGSTTKIQWKDPSKGLTTLHPRTAGEDEDDMPAESGSFFNFFEHESDPFDIGIVIANEIFSDAIDYFLGLAGGDELDSDDEESDDDDEEIDLEKPKSKKQKV